MWIEFAKHKMSNVECVVRRECKICKIQNAQCSVCVTRENAKSLLLFCF